MTLWHCSRKVAFSIPAVQSPKQILG